MELSESVNQLLEVKRERDGLLEEKKQLVEAKESYHTRASELKERVQTLMVSWGARARATQLG